MNTNRLLIGGVAVALVAGAGAWVFHRPPAAALPQIAPPHESSSPAAVPETIAASGKIMGIGVGSEMETAREKFDPLRGGEEHAPDSDKEEGERAYWKLKETEYGWIIAWADEAGKITRMRAMLRPDKLKPFQDIGNLATATVNQPNTVAWNLTAADGSPFRVVAQGPDQRATTIYMFSLRSTGDGD